MDPVSDPTTAPLQTARREAASRRRRLLIIRESVEIVTTDLPTDATTVYYTNDHHSALVLTTREAEHAPYMVRICCDETGEVWTQSSTGSAWQRGWEA